ncbi:adenylate/guanylate cyclase domain-containing protein [Mycobacterium sp. E787]|uniref:ATP-binding protein n=1 Tax=Mycobacterium sp. E787 TaxID=1834150 RepID=UPI0008013DB9|nr:adenylate/guanylate cyclase domain-containing protein [Mycobacterium sp. E787]OBI53891.1 cyclase [Mycobacterium sp. E787]
MTAAAPSGVVTFLFTDVEGSTRRWEADAPAMRAALVVHDKVLRTAIEAYDGFLFSHTGDGFVAAFASPMSAVNAAIEAQRELQLPVRMGLATGEAELRDGDYFGTVLNRAARVMAAGHGGQILLADSTAGLLNGIDLIDLGPRRLRDIPSSVQVFQVRAAVLRTEFPPLRALDVSPGNLRAAPTSFIGRESEAGEVQVAVKAHRLVTLTGVGGVGKTRLALEVARRLSDEFPDGVWLFELAAVTDPAAVPDAVAAVLGITQQFGRSVAESVAAALEGRVRLLVFDNCEHVLVAAADLIEAILAQSATVRVLATSREGLGAPDEQLWPVPSLDVGGGIDSAAVDLFVERARSVAPHFSIDKPDEAAAVVEICRRLDGVPLAIELAASRIAAMTAGEVRDRLDQRFRLLVGARRGLERHSTLRHAVAWSYDLLDEPEKMLLDRSSVFADGFDLQSACAVAGFDDDFATLDLLDALVRKSLLVADRSSGRTRFSMLETIRQFAEDQLVARGDASAIRNAHARYFAGREADILALWDSPRQREAYEWFMIELANLRTAFRWGTDNADLDVAATIATYVGWLGTCHQSYEPVAWAEELIEAAHAAGHPRLAFLYVIASQCYATGRIEAALRYYDAGQIVLGRSHEVLPYGIDGWLGAVYLAVGRPERMAEWCRARLARRRDANAVIRSILVIALALAGSNGEAMDCADGLIEEAEAAGNPHWLASALGAYGSACRDANPVAAIHAFSRGLMVAQDSGNRANASILAGFLARLECRHGDNVSAFHHLTLAIRNYHNSGNTTTLRGPLADLAVLFDRLGRHEPAATIAGFALSPLSASAVPEITPAITHLREVLGEATYGSLARKGETMTTAEIMAYAYDQIDQAQIELNEISK